MRDFLDSRYGRHFPDDVAGEIVGHGPEQLEAAVAVTVARWQGWRISRRTSRDEGIPAGLPYLTRSRRLSGRTLPRDRRAARRGSGS